MGGKELVMGFDAAAISAGGYTEYSVSTCTTTADDSTVAIYDADPATGTEITCNDDATGESSTWCSKVGDPGAAGLPATATAIPASGELWIVIDEFSSSAYWDSATERVFEVELIAPAVVSGSFFFSEYVEGSSFNKALELYNATGAPIADLSVCTIKTYSNGSPTASNTYTLPAVSLPANETLVICHSSFDAAQIATYCPLGNPLRVRSNSPTGYNGNDALVLECDLGAGPVVLDAFGQVGVNASFGTDVTLRRQAGIVDGDTDPSNAFDNAIEWDSFASNTFDGLGTR